jgi:hypothetical protein
MIADAPAPGHVRRGILALFDITAGTTQFRRATLEAAR